MIGFAFAGLVLGLILGVYCPFRVPPEYARLLAVAVMAGMDAVLGGKIIPYCLRVRQPGERQCRTMQQWG